jgi:hypothetical protein
MAWSDDTFITAFDAEASGVASLATSAQKIIWFNEGQARLLQWRPRTSDFSWVTGARTETLPTDFRKFIDIVYDVGTMDAKWRVLGRDLVIYRPEGALADGSARLFYYGDWTPMTTSTTATDLSPAQDNACLYYALHRFYKRLSSSRAYYKRYATLVGQNNVTMSDLQQESDRYYQDFLDARDDVEPEETSFYFED